MERGMKVGWRRGAGQLPLTEMERGERGAWLEKRRAVWAHLRDLGHEIVPMSQPTKASCDQGMHHYAPNDVVDVLVIEFAGMNMSWYGAQWGETCGIITRHRGPVVFITDDPELTFPWELLRGTDWSRWTVAVNAVHLDEARTVLKVPHSAAIVDFPVGSLLTARGFAGGWRDCVYYGRFDGGRKAQLGPYLGTGRVIIVGRTSEWAGVEVEQPPQQYERAGWYGQFKMALAGFDRKHARTGWRTGRAYHALLAGVPVVVPSGNDGLKWATHFTADELPAMIDAGRESHEFLRNEQLAAMRVMEDVDWKALGL